MMMIMMTILIMAMITMKISTQQNALAPPLEFDDAEIRALQQEGGMERSMIEVGMMMMKLLMMMVTPFPKGGACRLQRLRGFSRRACPLSSRQSPHQAGHEHHGLVNDGLDGQL